MATRIETLNGGAGLPLGTKASLKVTHGDGSVEYITLSPNAQTIADLISFDDDGTGDGDSDGDDGMSGFNPGNTGVARPDRADRKRCVRADIDAHGGWSEFDHRRCDGQQFRRHVLWFDVHRILSE